jgi:hypothetical protein
MRRSSLLLFACVLPAQAADSPSRAALREHAAVVARSPQVHGHRLCVKLAEGCGAEWVAGHLQSHTGVDLGAAAALFASAAVEPLFTALPWAGLDLWHRRACAVLPVHQRPGHLGLWFRLELPDAAAADALTEKLFDCPLVEHVHKEPRGTPASCATPAFAGGRIAGGGVSSGDVSGGDIPPPTPLFTSLQSTHLPAPTGLGVWRAQTVYGARGQGTQVLMVEHDWYLDHEDMDQMVLANFLGAYPGGNSGDAAHGTAGASVLVADRNEFGMTGMVDETRIRFLATGSNGGLANAILQAGVQGQPGDLILFVLMFLLGQISTTDWVPMEFLQSVYDATATVTGNGRLLVCAAGNGANNLDDPRLMRRFDRSFRDSGAILAAATAGDLPTRASYSNFGSRIDACAQGLYVVACGVGTMFWPNGDRRQAYTADHQGTSSATALIAGAMVALQGAARAQLGRSLDNAEIRSLLHQHGTPSPDAIGKRPDLPAMLVAMGAGDGLWASHPDLPLGGSVQVELSGPAGSGALLFASFAPGRIDLGLNRPVLLAQAGLLSLGFLALPAGQAAFPVQLPNVATLHGVSLYFQAGVLQGSGLRVTNSVQITGL